MRRVDEFRAELPLASGGRIPEARLVYATYGELAPDGGNAVLFPTRFGAGHEQNEFLIGPGRALDPARYFVIVPNMLGNGISSSPSNTPPPLDGPRFPRVTTYDNVVLQRRLLTEVLGVERLALAVGWSMGAQQAYQWASAFPDAVERLLVICGAARTAPHNIVFLESLRAALQADGTFAGGDYRTPPRAGLRAVGRIYAGWAYSQDWYREGGFRQMGFDSLEDYLPGYWDTLFEAREANDLMAMIDTWIHHDIAAAPQAEGELAPALAAIRARTVLMPCDRDLYFRTADNERELPHLRHARLSELSSMWGHMAASGQNPDDNERIDAAIAELLAEPAPADD